jgi:hypothetical protein
MLEITLLLLRDGYKPGELELPGRVPACFIAYYGIV